MIVLLAAPLAELVPMPALAALLIVAGYQGLRLEAAQTIWHTSRVSTVVMALTFLATLFIPLQYAVLIGVASERRALRGPPVQQGGGDVVGAGGGRIAPGTPAPRELPSRQLTMLQIYGSLFFAAAKSLEEMLPTVDNTTARSSPWGCAAGLRSAAPSSPSCSAMPRRCRPATAS